MLLALESLLKHKKTERVKAYLELGDKLVVARSERKKKRGRPNSILRVKVPKAKRATEDKYIITVPEDLILEVKYFSVAVRKKAGLRKGQVALANWDGKKMMINGTIIPLHMLKGAVMIARNPVVDPKVSKGILFRQAA